MATATEYAKVITSYPLPGTTIYGIRSAVTLPSETWCGVNEPTNGNGYLDVYLSLDRKNTAGTVYHYECGLSQPPGHAHHYGLANNSGDGKWHWFAAAGSDGGAFDSGTPSYLSTNQYAIELSCNPTTGALDFKVGGVTVKSFTGKNTFVAANGITNARLVIGAVDQDFLTAGNIPASPLTAWGTYTNQIVCGNYAVQRSLGGAWELVNPVPISSPVYWPQGSTHQTTPQFWTTSTTNGNLTASLKQ